MTHEWIIWLFAWLCLIVSFVLSGMEAGVFALSRLRIRQQMRAGRRSAAVLHGYLENPENFLWTILVGNTIANLLILGWLVIVLHRVLEAHYAWFAPVYALILLVFYAVSDLLPKMLFRLYPTRLTVLFARPFRTLHFLLRPLVGVLEWCSDLLLRWRGGKAFTGHLFGNREELRLVMQESSPTLTSEEKTMINRVLDLQTLTVRQVMLPVERAVTVNSNSPVSEVLALARARKLTRFPVWESREGTRRIVGLASVNSLLYQDNVGTSRSISEYLKPALFLEEDLRLEVALRRMQKGAQRLAIVLGRDRREVGILSLQDVLKVIFGEVNL
jgi:CBS domain containing-hemolysin-like protein